MGNAARRARARGRMLAERAAAAPGVAASIGAAAETVVLNPAMEEQRAREAFARAIAWANAPAGTAYGEGPGSRVQGPGDGAL